VAVTATGTSSEITVEVRDRGPGIAPQHQTRVFERFWQADGSPTGGGGAGLGLAICQRIVEHHGGAIRITGNHPQGACVSVALPARPTTDH
jgi:signal transduction histidine kinase